MKPFTEISAEKYEDACYNERLHLQLQSEIFYLKIRTRLLLSKRVGLFHYILKLFYHLHSCALLFFVKTESLLPAYQSIQSATLWFFFGVIKENNYVRLYSWYKNIYICKFVQHTFNLWTFSEESAVSAILFHFELFNLSVRRVRYKGAFIALFLELDITLSLDSQTQLVSILIVHTYVLLQGTTEGYITLIIQRP